MKAKPKKTKTDRNTKTMTKRKKQTGKPEYEKKSRTTEIEIERQSHIQQRQRKIKSLFHIHSVSKARWSRLKIQTGASISQTRRLPGESLKHIVASSFLSDTSFFHYMHLHVCLLVPDLGLNT